MILKQYLADNDFKAAVVSMLNDIKENIIKKEITIKNQIKILELKT